MVVQKINAKLFYLFLLDLVCVNIVLLSLDLNHFAPQPSNNDSMGQNKLACVKKIKYNVI